MIDVTKEAMLLALLKIALVVDCDVAWCECGHEARDLLGLADEKEAAKELDRLVNA